MADMAAIAADFAGYAGQVPYLWAGATPKGWDCSGACNWVICHDMGYDIPGYRGGTFDGRAHGPATGTWLGWSGLRQISRSKIAKGTICLWPTHMGVAVSATHYISAYDTQLGTVVEPIHGGGPNGETATFYVLKQGKPRAGGGGGGGGGGGHPESGKEWDSMQRSWSALRGALGMYARQVIGLNRQIEDRARKVSRR